MWIYALAGAGKSTLAHTTAEWCDGDGVLAAGFFCAQDGDRSNVQAIVPTIAHQLAKRCPLYREALCDAVAKISSIPEMSVASQLKKLVVGPLRSAISRGSKAFDGCVVIIDALDECKDDNAVSTVLRSLSLHIVDLRPLRFLITSRPNENVVAGFGLRALAENTRVFPLSRIPDDVTERDIRTFLQNRLDEVRARCSGLSPQWPPKEQLDQLVELTELLFIFAATAVLFINDKEALDPAGRLSQLLQHGNCAAALGDSLTSPFRILDVLYLQVLYSATKGLGGAVIAQLKLILGVVVFAEERLSPTTLETLLGLANGTVRRLLSLLRAILVLPPLDDWASPIRLIHMSFANFIIDSSRCSEPAFLINPAIHHTLLAERCLRALLDLRHNICRVDPKDGHLLNSEIAELPDRIARYLPGELQYACKYWSHHLYLADFDQQLLDILQAFCEDHLLNWLEALSLLGRLDVAIAALQTTQQKLQKLHLPPTSISPLLYDCERIVRTFYEGISASFFEVLKATVTFGPVGSLLRQRCVVDLQGIVQLRCGRDISWSDTLTYTDTDGRVITCLDFSPDGNLVACGIRYNTIQLRNVQTGAEVQIIEGGGGGMIETISFSPSGKEILSGDIKGRVDLYDVSTGACLGTWKRHSDLINSVAWSSDGTLAASASDDSTIVLWTVASPEESTVLTAHRDWIWALVFAADGALLSGSLDTTCRIWETPAGSLSRTLEHDSPVVSLAVSADSETVACGLLIGYVVLWKKAEGTKLHTIPGPLKAVSLAFYSNDVLATAYRGNSSLILRDVTSLTL
ncbi:WD40 repeat-like protein [Trametes sanguinea]|nr:WD40 repeat-like protein [Trametes sanguinea]